MLSAILVAPPAAPGRSATAGPMMRTLAALVPATVEGVVRDVALLDLADDDDLAALADEAGCRLVAGPDFAEAFGRAVAAARSTLVFVLKAGAVPSRLFGEEVVRFLGRGPEDAGSLVLRQEPSGAFERVLPGRMAPVAGVIVSRARLASTRFKGFGEVVRHARPATPLPSRATIRL